MQRNTSITRTIATAHLAQCQQPIHNAMQCNVRRGGSLLLKRNKNQCTSQPRSTTTFCTRFFVAYPMIRWWCIRYASGYRTIVCVSGVWVDVHFSQCRQIIFPHSSRKTNHKSRATCSIHIYLYMRTNAMRYRERAKNLDLKIMQSWSWIVERLLYVCFT